MRPVRPSFAALSILLVATLVGCKSTPDGGDDGGGVAPIDRDAAFEALRAELSEADLGDPGGPLASRARDLEMLALGWVERGAHRDASVAWALAAILHREAELPAHKARLALLQKAREAGGDPREREMVMRHVKQAERVVDVVERARVECTTQALTARDDALGARRAELSALIDGGGGPIARPTPPRAFRDRDLGKRIIEAIAAKLDGGEDPVRRRLAALGLAISGEAARLRAVVEATPEAGVMIGVLEAAALAGPRAIDDLVPVLDAGEPASARVHAALGIGIIGGDAARAALGRAAASDVQPALVRMAASVGLARAGGRAARKRVIAGIADEELTVRQLATFSTRLLAPSPASVAALVVALDDEDPTVRVLAVGGLGTALAAGVPGSSGGAGAAAGGTGGAAAGAGAPTREGVVAALLARVGDEAAASAVPGALADAIDAARARLAAPLLAGDGSGLLAELAFEVAARTGDEELTAAVASTVANESLTEAARASALTALGRAVAAGRLGRADDEPGPDLGAAPDVARDALVKGPDPLRRAALAFFVLADVALDPALGAELVADDGEAAPFAALLLTRAGDEAGRGFVTARLASTDTPELLAMAELVVLAPDASLLDALERLVPYEDQGYFPTDRFVGWAARRALARILRDAAEGPR